MRICIVSLEFPPVSDYYGGIGAQYARLAPALVRIGVEVHAITPLPASGEAPRDVDGVQIHALRSPRGWPWHLALWSSIVERQLDALGPFDLVIAPEYRGEAWRYSARQTAGPLVTHLLTSTEQYLAIRPGLTLLERHGPRTQLTRTIERRQTERSRALLAPGRAVLEWARQLWPNGRSIDAQIVPLSIDIAAIRKSNSGDLPHGFPANSGGPIVGLASRLDGHKGAQHLVAAMQTVWREYRDAQLVFIGRDARWRDGWMSDHLMELAGKRRGQTHVLGYQPPEQYFSAVAACDVVAIPSLWESFCLAALESMALSRPLIGTTGNGFSEFIADGENGLLVERGDVSALAQALERLLRDEALRRRMGEAAASTAERHDAGAVAPLYADAFERVQSTLGRDTAQHR